MGRGALDDERRQRGQSLAEFTLVLPLLLIILAGALDLGRLYFAYVAVTDVAGEGASYAAAYLPSSDGPCPDQADLSCPYDPHNPDPEGNDRRHLDCTCQRAYGATRGAVQGETLDVVVTVPSGSTFGSQITVTVQYTHELVTPVLNAIVPGGQLPLTAHARERVVDPSTE
jgi:Flp pilus assembly protein TadG